MAVEEPQPKPEPTPSQTINTGGGAYVAGNVDTRGGAFIGRDLVVKIGIPLALALVIGIAMFAVAVNQGWIFASQIRPIVDPLSVEQQKMPPGYFNIAVAPLDVSSARGDPKNLQKLGSNLSGLMAAYLKGHLLPDNSNGSLQNALVWANDLPGIPPIKPPIAPLRSKTDADLWQDRLNATLLIYGRLVGDPNNTQLVPEFSYSSPQVSELPDIDSGHHPFGAPVSIAAADDAATAMLSQQTQPDLGRRAEAFVWLITALTQANAKLPEAALATLQTAQAKIGAEDHSQLKAIFAYYEGLTALQIPNLPAAHAAFTAVRDPQQPISGTLQAIATIGLGNYHFLRAQGFFNAEQAQNAGLAQCAAAFSGTKLALGSSPDGPNAAEIPADLAGVSAALQSAEDLYAEADRWLAQTDPQQQDADLQHTRAVAAVMTANAQRLDGESALYALTASDADEQQRAALLDRAAKMLDTAIGAYTEVAARFEQMQNYSVQSYALYNLGLAQKARADLYLDSYDDAAHGVPLYRQAADTFARCSALSDRPDKSVRPDKDGYTGLQKRMRCFCDLEQGAVKDTLHELE
ncbi:MAG: hypothetical protein U0X20_10945 [Caldilineaceae bacterium]